MRFAACLGFCSLVVALAAAQDPIENPAAIPSKGNKGELVPSGFRSYIVIDERYAPKVAGSTNPNDRHPKDTTDKMHDLVAEHGLSPVVAIFVRDSEQKKLDPQAGVGKLAAELNKLMTIPDYRGNKLAAFVMFLRITGMEKTITLINPDKSQTMVELDAEYPQDEKRDKPHAEDVRNFATAVKAPNVVFALGPVKSKAGTTWNIGETDEVTVVFYNRNRIIERWKFGADGPSADEIKQILATVESTVLGKKP
jgi:hypothetical protein